jgi:hypothetical protein
MILAALIDHAQVTTADMTIGRGAVLLTSVAIGLIGVWLITKFERG